MGDCLIGFGSNMGDSRAIYQAVQDSFAQAPEIDRCVPSRLKKTTPVGGQSQDLYLNGALRIESPDILFASTQGNIKESGDDHHSNDDHPADRGASFLLSFSFGHG